MTELEALLDGLRAPQKSLSPKYFYDEHGSRLFESITEQPEYYPTRTELGILREHIDDIGAMLGESVSLIEFGAGASVKVRVLLDALPQIHVFVPVDISGDHLFDAATELRRDYPDIEILPVAADFTQPFELPNPERIPKRNVVFFPGSTIGNFPPAAALDLLRVMRAVAKNGGALLIGVDLRKDHEILERAYDDAKGVTAAFNKNMLQHLNARFDANFEPDAFQHRAIYNADDHRIEMHLISNDAQSFNVGKEHFSMEADEYILTEYSYKHSRESFAELAEAAGFHVRKVWTDADALFSLQFCEVATRVALA
ncbi:MAG: L-histidine N(alpha)-methyltransferase [Woeseiaceae bacterium]